METTSYDIITIGGGLGGAALAKVMAESGARVLVLESEPQFKDRVRGEVMLSWGVAPRGVVPLDEGVDQVVRCHVPHHAEDAELGGERRLHEAEVEVAFLEQLFEHRE